MNKWNHYLNIREQFSNADDALSCVEFMAIQDGCYGVRIIADYGTYHVDSLNRWECDNQRHLPDGMFDVMSTQAFLQSHYMLTRDGALHCAQEEV